MSRMLALLLCVAATMVAADPNGFLMAFIADPARADHLYPYAISTATGDAKQLQEDYMQASVANTMNGGDYNPATNQYQFIGSSLTMAKNGPEPNPVMNFLVSVDPDGQYMSKRLIAYGAFVAGVRNTDLGVNYGMEQAVSGGQDARLDIIQDTGLCGNIYNTSAQAGFVVGHMAIDSQGERFFVSVKSESNDTITLQTINLANQSLMASVALPARSATTARVFLCYDQSTRGLYSLESDSAAITSDVYRVDPFTGASQSIMRVNMVLTVADCGNGTMWVTGLANGKTPRLYVVDLNTGANAPVDIKVPSAPVAVGFFPQ